MIWFFFSENPIDLKHKKKKLKSGDAVKKYGYGYYYWITT